MVEIFHWLNQGFNECHQKAKAMGGGKYQGGPTWHVPRAVCTNTEGPRLDTRI